MIGIVKKNNCPLIFCSSLTSSFHFRDLIIQVNVLVQKPADEFSGKSSALHHGQHVFDRFPDFFIGAFVTISFGVHPPVGTLDGSLDDFFHIFFKIGFPLRSVFDAGGTGKPPRQLSSWTGLAVSEIFSINSRALSCAVASSPPMGSITSK